MSSHHSPDIGHLAVIEVGFDPKYDGITGFNHGDESSAITTDANSAFC